VSQPNNIKQRLRDTALKLRTSSIALSDFIPLLQQAADHIEALENKTGEPQDDQRKWTGHQRNQAVS
jgi:hypothetical protein